MCSEENETEWGTERVRGTTAYRWQGGPPGGGHTVAEAWRRQGAESAQQRMGKAERRGPGPGWTILLRALRGWRLLDRGGQGHGGSAPKACDALRPHEAGRGAAQPGQALVRPSPRVLTRREGTWRCPYMASGLPVGGGGGGRVSFQLLVLPERGAAQGTGEPKGKMTLQDRRAPGTDGARPGDGFQDDGHGTASLSPCSNPSGFFLERALAFQTQGLKPDSAVSELCSPGQATTPL